MEYSTADSDVQSKSEYMRAWRARNRERLREYHKKWARENPDKIKQYATKYWERRSGEKDG